jgi:1,4-alpha-glucan branching enzyme
MNATSSPGRTDCAAPQDSHRPVRFYCAAPKAQHVDLVGDFSQWNPVPMTRSGDGWWVTQVELPHGYHLYRYLVDGEPRLDSSAMGTVRDRDNRTASVIAVSWEWMR